MPAPITPSLTSRYLHQSAGLLKCNCTKQSRSQASGALAAAAVMRITPDLHHRSSKKSLHTFREKNMVPHSTHLRFNTFLDTNSAKRHCCRSPPDPTGPKNAPNRFPVQFYSRWDVRPPFSQKIFSENRKIPKNLFGHYLNPSRKKNRDLNRISLTLSNRR